MAAMRTRGCFALLPSPASLILTLSVSISESKTTNHSCCVHFGGWTACGKSSRVRLGWEARTVRPRGWVFGSGEREWRRWSRRCDGTSIVAASDMRWEVERRRDWPRDARWRLFRREQKTGTAEADLPALSAYVFSLSQSPPAAS